MDMEATRNFSICKMAANNCRKKALSCEYLLNELVECLYIPIVILK